MMDTITNIMSNWQAWAVWIVFVSLLIGLLHYFNNLGKDEGCWCEYEVFHDSDDWSEYMIDHQYECTK
jgi:hypothetical protein